MLAEDFDRAVAWDAIGTQEIAAAHDHTAGVAELTPGEHLLAVTKRTTGCWPIGILLHKRWRSNVASWGLTRDRIATLLLSLRTGPGLGESTWVQITTAPVPSTVGRDPEAVGAVLQAIAGAQRGTTNDAFPCGRCQGPSDKTTDPDDAGENGGGGGPRRAMPATQDARDTRREHLTGQGFDMTPTTSTWCTTCEARLTSAPSQTVQPTTEDQDAGHEPTHALQVPTEPRLATEQQATPGRRREPPPHSRAPTTPTRGRRQAPSEADATHPKQSPTTRNPSATPGAAKTSATDPTTLPHDPGPRANADAPLSAGRPPRGVGANAPRPTRTAAVAATPDGDTDEARLTNAEADCETGYTRTGLPPADRDTWQGNLFGTLVQRTLDYVFIDARSRDRTTRTHIRSVPTLPFRPPGSGPHDHAHHDRVDCRFPLRSQAANTDNTDKVDGASATSEGLRTTPVEDLRRGDAELGPRRHDEGDAGPYAMGQRSPQSPLVCQTRDAGQTRCATPRGNDDDERRAMRAMLAKMTDRIRKDKDRAQGNYILQHLREGGWGARDVAAPMAPMPYHQETGKQEKAFGPMTIAAHATTYYAVFTDPGGDDTEVANLISRRSTDWHNDKAALTTEDVRRATMALARGKTTGDDCLPAEAWQTAMIKDERMTCALTWAFNRRIFDLKATDEADAEALGPRNAGADDRAGSTAVNIANAAAPTPTERGTDKQSTEGRPKQASSTTDFRHSADAAKSDGRRRDKRNGAASDGGGRYRYAANTSAGCPPPAPTQRITLPALPSSCGCSSPRQLPQPRHTPRRRP